MPGGPKDSKKAPAVGGKAVAGGEQLEVGRQRDGRDPDRALYGHCNDFSFFLVGIHQGFEQGSDIHILF